MYPALSVKPSWAWCTRYGTKRIENRSWTTDYRGWVWLHASAQESRKEYLRTYDYAQKRGVILPERERLLSGGIIAAVRLDDVRMSSVFPRELGQWEFSTVPGDPKPNYAWRWGAMVPTPYLACKGSQQLWTPKPERFYPGRGPDDWAELERFAAKLEAGA